jgi:hypothetical protein
MPMEEIPQQTAKDAKDFLLFLIEEPRHIEPLQVTPIII